MKYHKEKSQIKINLAWPKSGRPLPRLNRLF